jgi:HAD superfamily hydrolase (TIGR01509 family)
VPFGKTPNNLAFCSFLCNFAADFLKVMEKKEMKAALFDLDGVVFDTEPQYSVFWGAQCREFHPEHPGLEHEIKGQTLVQIYDAWFSGELTEKQPLITERLNKFEQQMDYIYVPGFEEYIRELRSKGVKTAVVTSSNQPKMEAVYQSHLEFRSMFDAILTSEDFERSKPNPDCYLKAAQRLGVNVGDCVVYEDSFNGLKSGRAAGMYVVGLSTTNPATAIRPYCDEIIENYK